MPDKLPEVSDFREFVFLLLAGFSAGLMLYVFDRLVTPQLVKLGLPAA